MVAQTELTTSTQPTLSFAHRLTQINVSITETNISLTNAVVEIASQLTVDCDLAASTFEGTGDLASVVATANATNYFTAIVASATIPSGTEFITITVGDMVFTVVTSKDVVLVQGVSYTYEGTINADGECEFTAKISDWGEGGYLDLDDEKPEDDPVDEPEDVIITAAISADCDFVNGKFEGTGEDVAVTPLAISDTSFFGVIPPQTIAKGSMLLQATVDGVVYDWFMSQEVVLASGYKYICSVTISDSEVKFSGEIESWDNGGLLDFGDDPEENDPEEDDPSETLNTYTLSEISADNIPTKRDEWAKFILSKRKF